MRLRLLVLLLLSFTLGQHVTLPPSIHHIAFAAQKAPKTGKALDKSLSPAGEDRIGNDRFDAKEAKKPSLPDQSTEQWLGQQDTSTSRTVFGDLVGTLVSWIPPWPFFVGGLLLLGFIVDRIYAVRRSERAMDTLNGLFDALDKEMNIIKRSLGDLSNSLQSLASQTRATPLNPRAETALDIQEITSRLNKMESQLENIPARASDDVIKRLDLREKHREEEKERNKIASLYATLAQKIEALPIKYPVIAVASATSDLLSSLRSLSRDWEGLSGTYMEYLKLGKQWEEFKSLQSKLVQMSPEIPVNVLRQLGEQLQATEEASEVLAKNHRITWFTGLLNDAALFPAIKDLVVRLQDILNIEEIPLEAGGEIKDRELVDVVITEGGGDRAFIKEVLEKGYFEKTSRLVLKRAKVTVRLD